MLVVQIVCLLSTVFAHGNLNYPKPRGYDSKGTLVAPCGKGFDNAGSRTTVKSAGFKINLTVGDEDAQIVVNAGTGPNPATFPYVVATTPASLEKIDIPIDFSSIPDLKNGDPVSIQVINTAADGIKYVCADLIIETPDSGSTSTLTMRDTASPSATHSSTQTPETLSQSSLQESTFGTFSTVSTSSPVASAVETTAALKKEAYGDAILSSAWTGQLSLALLIGLLVIA